LKPSTQSRTRTIAAGSSRPTFQNCGGSRGALARAEAQRRLAAEELAQRRKPKFKKCKITCCKFNPREQLQQTIQQAIARARVAESQINLDEQETRRLIDLSTAGGRMES